MKKNVFSKIVFVVLLVTLFTASGMTGLQEKSMMHGNVVEAVSQDAPKYVFYFIGDGMGASQRQMAEYYLQETTNNKDAKLVINNLPVAGINTTYSEDSLVTDSAAAGTALATGYKTNNGMIAQLPNGKKVKTLVEAAEEKGMATGIVSTTRLTHATPAVFASHNASRDNENEIAEDFVTSGVDFFAGGGARYFIPKDGLKDGEALMKSKRVDNRNLIKEFEKSGYKTFLGKTSTDAFRNMTVNGQQKVFAAFNDSHMPYEVDRVHNNDVPSLAEMTEKGIDVLSEYDKGFFMMVEGGRIDHACHANDAKGAINDTLAFDEAVKKAYTFYKEHPKETLIVVVGDHETGGMGLGFGKNYFLKMNNLKDVKISVEDVLQGKYTGDRDTYFKYIAENFGLKNLTTDEKAKIEKAMDRVDKKEEIDRNEYGGYDPVAIEATHVLSERTNMQWTTYAHTATSIPMSAVGVGQENFSGYKDNTEIAQDMAKLMRFALTK
ncbi:alkaline phosphatase [Marinisporobacter balticus]|uniref:Alkaline phosphatase n=1 Tax=Marinisporobacter balticus TaxID=2018667 RepID=A0A4R2KR21_9FIRM|nr:alkaline phosphatase [Marinisporobacter balticus]TCO69055.1 alkaline phosphatase [Marinisporobacter balticus]